MRKILFFVIVVALSGCGILMDLPTPQLEGKMLQKVSDSIDKDDGAIIYTHIGVWFPETNVSDGIMSRKPAIRGYVVITERSLLFQQWGGATGLTTIKRVPLAEIKEVSSIDYTGLFSIRTVSDNYDSFMATGGEDGSFPDSGSNNKMNKLLSELTNKLNLPSAQK